MGLFNKNEAVKAVEGSMLLYPNDWYVGEYTTTHKKSGTSIWTAHGLMFINIKGLPSISLIDKIALRKAINKLKVTQVLQSINK